MRCSANIATRLSRAQFNELEVSIPTRSLVDCITIMSEFEFSVHTTELSALLGLAGRLRHELVTLLLCVLGVATSWGEGSVGNAQTFFLARAPSPYRILGPGDALLL